MASDPTEPTPSTVNHTGAIVGGKQVFLGYVTRSHVLYFIRRCNRGNSRHRVIRRVRYPVFASEEAYEPGKSEIGKKAASGGGIPLIAGTSLSAHYHSGEFPVRLVGVALSHQMRSTRSGPARERDVPRIEQVRSDDGL